MGHLRGVRRGEGRGASPTALGRKSWVRRMGGRRGRDQYPKREHILCPRCYPVPPVFPADVTNLLKPETRGQTPFLSHQLLTKLSNILHPSLLFSALAGALTPHLDSATSYLVPSSAPVSLCPLPLPHRFLLCLCPSVMTNK